MQEGICNRVCTAPNSLQCPIPRSLRCKGPLVPDSRPARLWEACSREAISHDPAIPERVRSDFDDELCRGPWRWTKAQTLHLCWWQLLVQNRNLREQLKYKHQYSDRHVSNFFLFWFRLESCPQMPRRSSLSFMTLKIVPRLITVKSRSLKRIQSSMLRRLSTQRLGTLRSP